LEQGIHGCIGCSLLRIGTRPEPGIAQWIPEECPEHLGVVPETRRERERERQRDRERERQRERQPERETERVLYSPIPI
jgi:hypothetical protein